MKQPDALARPQPLASRGIVSRDQYVRVVERPAARGRAVYGTAVGGEPVPTWRRGPR